MSALWRCRLLGHVWRIPDPLRMPWGDIICARRGCDSIAGLSR